VKQQRDTLIASNKEAADSEISAQEAIYKAQGQAFSAAMLGWSARNKLLTDETDARRVAAKESSKTQEEFELRNTDITRREVAERTKLSLELVEVMRSAVDKASAALTKFGATNAQNPFAGLSELDKIKQGLTAIEEGFKSVANLGVTSMQDIATAQNLYNKQLQDLARQFPQLSGLILANQIAVTGTIRDNTKSLDEQVDKDKAAINKVKDKTDIVQVLNDTIAATGDIASLSANMVVEATERMGAGFAAALEGARKLNDMMDRGRGMQTGGGTGFDTGKRTVDDKGNVTYTNIKAEGSPAIATAPGGTTNYSPDDSKRPVEGGVKPPASTDSGKIVEEIRKTNTLIQAGVYSTSKNLANDGGYMGASGWVPSTVASSPANARITAADARISAAADAMDQMTKAAKAAAIQFSNTRIGELNAREAAATEKYGNPQSAARREGDATEWINAMKKASDDYAKSYGEFWEGTKPPNYVELLKPQIDSIQNLFAGIDMVPEPPDLVRLFTPQISDVERLLNDISAEPKLSIDFDMASMPNLLDSVMPQITALENACVGISDAWGEQLQTLIPVVEDTMSTIDDTIGNTTTKIAGTMAGKVIEIVADQLEVQSASGVY
jgi:hypothetical protein